MKIFKNKEDSLKFGLSLFLIAGSVLGTLFCNMMTEEMKLELTVMEQSTMTQSMLAEVDFGCLFLRILPERIWTLVLVLLASATPMAGWLMFLIAGYFGFSSAIMVCSLTMGYGISGLLRYVILIFPQCLCYIPVGYLLLWWMPAKGKRLTLLSVLFLLVLVSIGAILESFVNPWMMTIF